MRFDNRVEPLGIDLGVKFGEYALHEPEVDGSDHLTMLVGSLAELAVVQQDLPLPPVRDRLGHLPDLVHIGIDTPRRWRQVGRVTTPGLAGLDRGPRGHPRPLPQRSR